jgi:ATP-dependent Clp protease ATP-binding subunit ClpA
VTIELTDDAREFLAKKGFDKTFGARPLGRVIQELIKQPLSEELLFGKLEKGGVVVVRTEDGKLTFDFSKASGNALPVKRKKGKVPVPVR